MPANGNPIFGSIEAGGTKFVLAVGDNQNGIIEQTSIPTTAPGETLQKVIDWFQGHGPIAALGIACFGPVDLNPASPTWGFITDTPKPDWSQTNVAGFLGEALNCPVGFDTDVNCAGLGEYLYGAAKGSRIAIYVTVGTGIGGGAVVDGRTVKGMRHPEMGHMRPRRQTGDTEFDGICNFHGDCLEGLASGPAIKARWGASLSELAQVHPAHDIIADYLAQFCQTLIAVYSPQCIVLGGGVMQTPQLIERIKFRTAELAGDYFGSIPANVIVAPGLGTLSGITGAFELARRASETKN